VFKGHEISEATVRFPDRFQIGQASKGDDSALRKQGIPSLPHHHPIRHDIARRGQPESGQDDTGDRFVPHKARKGGTGSKRPVDGGQIGQG
jgi:hypothetical protein